VTRRLHDELREAVRVLAGRSPAPTAAVIDSQSVKGADTGGGDQVARDGERLDDPAGGCGGDRAAA
jgi:hypothetical protein